MSRFLWLLKNRTNKLSLFRHKKIPTRHLTTWEFLLCFIFSPVGEGWEGALIFSLSLMLCDEFLLDIVRNKLVRSELC